MRALNLGTLHNVSKQLAGVQKPGRKKQPFSIEKMTKCSVLTIKTVLMCS